MTTPKKKQCFIIAPIGGPNSAERRPTDGLLASVIRPVLKDLDFQVLAAHEIDDSGNIPQQVITRVISDELVIADLTGLNPNVMFELAIRYSASLPVVLLAQEPTSLPFDFNQERTIFYINDMSGSENLKYRLRGAVESALADTQPDNPVYRAINDKLIREMAPAGDTYALILDKVDRLELAVSQQNRVGNITRTGTLGRYALLVDEKANLDAIIGKLNPRPRVLDQIKIPDGWEIVVDYEKPLTEREIINMEKIPGVIVVRRA